MHRVVITGMGMSTSLGPDLHTCWRRLLAGDSGIAPLSFWDPSEYSTKVVAEVKHVPRDTGSESIPAAWCRRGVRLFLPVAREALADAQLTRTGARTGEGPGGGLAPADIGIAAGTSVNYLDMSLMKHYFQLRKPDSPALDMGRFAREGRQPDNSFYRRLGDMIASVPAKLLKLAGPAFVMDTACAASSHAIGEAFRLVRLGKVKAMLAGGAAALVSPLPILAFSLLGALSRNADPELASRPFDRQRDGFVMGEGSGAVVLETLESAQARGAHIYAELAGYGSSLNAHTLTDPSPDGSAEAQAISIALRQACLAPEEVDYIAAHGTSTPKNDPIETAAIKRAFGPHAKRLMVSSNKGQIGHTISAAGVSNVICAVKAIAEGHVPPTMHLRSPDPQCDLDYVPNQSRAATVRAALANAFAFGGQNAVVAVRAWAG
jgi:3-oxoacyl-[acyl-carrier-protein] synthase II